MGTSTTECIADGRTGSVGIVVRQGNECEDQWEGVQDSGKTGTDGRGRDMGIEDGTGT